MICDCTSHWCGIIAIILIFIFVLSYKKFEDMKDGRKEDMKNGRKV